MDDEQLFGQPLQRTVLIEAILTLISTEHNQTVSSDTLDISIPRWKEPKACPTLPPTPLARAELLCHRPPK